MMSDELGVDRRRRVFAAHQKKAEQAHALRLAAARRHLQHLTTDDGRAVIDLTVAELFLVDESVRLRVVKALNPQPSKTNARREDFLARIAEAASRRGIHGRTSRSSHSEPEAPAP
jgi:hypothetical protein